jgi:hypothetical protein
MEFRNSWRGDSEVRERGGYDAGKGRNGTERIVQPDEYDMSLLNVPDFILTRPIEMLDRMGPRNVVMLGVEEVE